MSNDFQLYNQNETLKKVQSIDMNLNTTIDQNKFHQENLNCPSMNERTNISSFQCAYSKRQSNRLCMRHIFEKNKQEEIEKQDKNSFHQNNPPQQQPNNETYQAPSIQLSTNPQNASPDHNQSSQEQQSSVQSRTIIEPILFFHHKWDILPNRDYNIFGDILIETDFISDKKFSSQNHWKPPLNLEVARKKMITKMNIGSYGTVLRNFSFISHFMKMCNHEEIKSFSYHLDQWQHICNQMTISKQSYSSAQSDQIQSSSFLDDQQEIYSSRLREFEVQCERKIESLNKEGKIFSYSKKRYNCQTQNIEEYEYGINSYLLAIIGCDPEHFSTIIMRQGRPNLFDTKSRLKLSQQLVRNYLNINLSANQQISQFPDYIKRVNLITFDDLQVPSTAFSYCMNFNQNIIDDSSNIQYNFNSNIGQCPFSSSLSDSSNSEKINNQDYDFVLQIIELDIEASNISTLLNIREFNDHEQKLKELKENMQYEFDIHVLLEKYYKRDNKSSNYSSSLFYNDSNY